MDQSEADDRVKVNIDGQKEVSKCLIEVFDGKSASVQGIITTITSNLVFDDPGMLARSIIFDETERHVQDGTVLWLLNQIISVVNQSTNV